jgi:DnaJ-class molecular chaperone
MESDQARALLATLPNIEVIKCPMCGGCGELARALNVQCPRCLGCGVTTNSGEAVERWDVHDQRP